MGWFKKEKSEGIPSLPELPELPEIPETKFEKPHQLPSFPTNSLGEKFSQNAIKEAVSREKEDYEEGEDEVVELPKLKKPLTRELPLHKKTKMKLTRELPIRKNKTQEIPEEFEEAESQVRKAEPVFIRIDKFEKSLKVFEKTKQKINEIEKMLKDIQDLKEEEEIELEAWGSEIQNLKQQIEKIDDDVFSKID